MSICRENRARRSYPDKKSLRRVFFHRSVVLRFFARNVLEKCANNDVDVRAKGSYRGLLHGIPYGADAYVAPSSDDDNGLLSNLTGHPAVVVSNGFDEKG